MKTRSTTIDKVEHSEQHRQLAQTNQGGEGLTPALATLQTYGAHTDKLTQLAEDFKTAHKALDERKSELLKAYSRSVGEVVNLGRILIEAKKLAKRKYLEWLDKNTSISRKTAQRWAAVARNASAMSHLTPTSKKLTEHYHDLGILKKTTKKPKTVAGQTTPDAPAQKGEDEEKSADPNADLFVKAKEMSDRLAQMAVHTKDQDRMAGALKSIIGWYQDYLAMKKAAEEKAKQDAEFEKEYLLTA